MQFGQFRAGSFPFVSSFARLNYCVRRRGTQALFCKPKPGNGNVNTVYFVNQARGNTQISHGVCLREERARDCKCLLMQLYLSFALKHYKSM